jgi:hypothetical protein
VLAVGRALCLHHSSAMAYLRLHAFDTAARLLLTGLNANSGYIDGLIGMDRNECGCRPLRIPLADEAHVAAVATARYLYCASLQTGPGQRASWRARLMAVNSGEQQAARPGHSQGHQLGHSGPLCWHRPCHLTPLECPAVGKVHEGHTGPCCLQHISCCCCMHGS